MTYEKYLFIFYYYCTTEVPAQIVKNIRSDLSKMGQLTNNIGSEYGSIDYATSPLRRKKLTEMSGRSKLTLGLGNFAQYMETICDTFGKYLQQFAEQMTITPANVDGSWDYVGMYNLNLFNGEFIGLERVSILAMTLNHIFFIL